MLLQMVPNFLSHPKVGDSGTDRRSKTKGDVAQSLLVLFIPFLSVRDGMSLLVNRPLTLALR